MKNKSETLRYLNISRSSFYYHSILEEKDLILKEKIEKVMIDNSSYGHKRISIELKLGKKQILRVMKKYGMKPSRCRKKAWKRGKTEESASPESFSITFSSIQRSYLDYRFYISKVAKQMGIYLYSN